jgi:hypothetical protein
LSGLRAGWSGVRVPTGTGNFSLHHRVQAGSRAHPASYPMSTSGRGMTFTTHLRGQECVELYLYSPNTLSWSGAQLRKAVKQKVAVWIRFIWLGIASRGWLLRIRQWSSEFYKVQEFLMRLATVSFSISTESYRVKLCYPRVYPKVSGLSL